MLIFLFNTTYCVERNNKMRMWQNYNLSSHIVKMLKFLYVKILICLSFYKICQAKIACTRYLVRGPGPGPEPGPGPGPGPGCRRREASRL
jgi:hypothetical protein